MSRLPTVTYNGDDFFIDRRLNQLRNADNPHLYYEFDSQVDLEYFVIRLEKEEDDRIRRQERRQRMIRVTVWVILYSALFAGLAYLLGQACLALGTD